MADIATAPPILSTPDTHILSDTSDATLPAQHEALSDAQIENRYEIARTIKEIKERKWRRIALQFPDEMLPHSARVYQMLARGLRRPAQVTSRSPEHDASQIETTDEAARSFLELSLEHAQAPVKLTILADTSYGSCCVDEIAAEHVDADAIVHYGRACLSPTARMPVVHVYTQPEFDIDRATLSFKSNFPDPAAKVIVTADMPYASHVQPLCQSLADIGYDSVFAASIIHDPGSLIPNRTVPPTVTTDPASLGEWHLFHISTPPTSLLLTLTSRLAGITVHPISDASSVSSAKATSMLLRRRYALITSLATVPILGILINTLSVKNYLSVISHIQKLISDSGKKSYLFVVGKINAAKVANFSEIGGWVVVGCWESSLIDSKDFYKPIITPFELELALRSDETRVWTGEWRADFEGVLEAAEKGRAQDAALDKNGDTDDHRFASEEDSDEAPEFDLRTGQYVSRSKPMRKGVSNKTSHTGIGPSKALARRANGDMISVNGIASPAAEFLANSVPGEVWEVILRSSTKIRRRRKEH